MNLHEIEDQEFGQSGALWDADPDVCCAAFQLGACAHTEAFDEADLFDGDIDERRVADRLVSIVCRCGPKPHSRGYPECETARRAARAVLNLLHGASV